MNGTFWVDSLQKTFIIAEAGVNHNGNLDVAFKLIDAAYEAKVDAIKFQTFITESITTKNNPMAEYQKNNLNSNISQFDMIKPLELSFNDFYKIKEYCDSINIEFLSTSADNACCDFLDSIVPIFKIGSADLTNIPFIKHVASKRKPIILSTGMSYLSEIDKAIRVIIDNGNNDIALLHCTTNYPCPYGEVNLNAMFTLKNAFKLPVGYSDHTLGLEVPIAAVAMGAKIIEKHFTLDRNLPGPDHKASLEPKELKEMVLSIRNIELALGDGTKVPNRSEFEVMTVARKSLVAIRNLKTGDTITESDIVIKRPGNGIKPELLDIILGKKLIKDVKEDGLLTWDHFLRN